MTSHPIFARVYARMSPQMEQSGMGELRRRLLDGLTGEVIEVGAGNGLNFAHYPATVTRVLAVEPEPYLRRLAEDRAREAAVPVDVTAGVADRLPAGDGAFDAAVACLVLCTVRDQRRALAEIGRVLRPGGRLRFLEHVRAQTPALRRVQRAMDATMWPPLTGGCHTGRDTAAAIEAAGLTIETLERFRFPDMRIPLPASPHIIGTARTPGGGD